MSNFSSILELLVAFNLALVTSNFFLISLNTKLTGFLSSCKVLLNEIETKFSETETYLSKNIEAKRKANNIEFQAVVNKLVDFRTMLGSDWEREHKDISSEVGEREKREEVSVGFQIYCLYAGIISLLALAIPAFDEIFKITNRKLIDITNEIIMLSLIFSFISMLVMCSNRKPFFEYLECPSYRNVVKNLFIALGISVVLVLFFDFVLEKEILYDCTKFVIMLTLIASSGHFVYFFFNAFFTHKTKYNDLHEKITKFDKKFESFKTKIANISEVGPNVEVAALLRNESEKLSPKS